MQLQGLILAFFMFMLIPLMLLFSDHEAFFMILAVLLAVTCSGNIFAFFKGKKQEPAEEDEDEIEEIEESMDLDIRKFDTGIKVARELFVILFYAYCSFYIEYFPIRIAIAFLTVFKIYRINCIIKQEKDPENSGSKEPDKGSRWLLGLTLLFSDLLTLVLIAFAVVGKYCLFR